MAYYPKARNYIRSNFQAAKRMGKILGVGSLGATALMPAASSIQALVDSDNPELKDKPWYSRLGTGFTTGLTGAGNAFLRAGGTAARGIDTGLTRIGNIGRSLVGNSDLNEQHNKLLADSLQDLYNAQNDMLMSSDNGYTSSWSANIGQHILPTYTSAVANSITDPVAILTAAILPIGSSAVARGLVVGAPTAAAMTQGWDVLSGGKGRVVTKPVFTATQIIRKPQRAVRDVLGAQDPGDIQQTLGILNTALKDKQFTPFLLRRFDLDKQAQTTAKALKQHNARLFNIQGVDYTATKDLDIASLGAPILDAFGPDTDVLREQLGDVQGQVTKRLQDTVVPQIIKAWNTGRISRYEDLQPVIFSILKQDGLFVGKQGYISKALRKAIDANPRAKHIMSGKILGRRKVPGAVAALDAYGASVLSELPTLRTENPGMLTGQFNSHRQYYTNILRRYIDKYTSN